MTTRQDDIDCGNFLITTIVTNRPFLENCYLIRHRPSGAQLLIDPGIGADRILAKVRSGGDRLSEIWLTHGHLDHIGGVYEVQKALGVVCRAHMAEKSLIAEQPNWAARLANLRIETPLSCDFFEDEPLLSFAGAQARTIATPGHTPGGVCYLFHGFAFTGDTLFRQGIGRTDLPGGSTRKLSASITRLLDIAPPETVLFSGHGAPWTAGQAREWWRFMSQGLAYS